MKPGSEANPLDVHIIDAKRNLTKLGESEKNKCNGDKCHILHLGLRNQMHAFKMGATYRIGLTGLVDANISVSPMICSAKEAN